MSIIEFIKERMIFLIINLIMFLLVAILMKIVKVSINIILILFLIWFGPILIYMFLEFIKYRRYLNNLINTVENLDRKYLLPEVIEEPRFQEARIINDVLKQCNKSMHEKVKHYKDEQIEYREYIETWVHEIKTPIASARLILENDEGYINKSVLEEIEKVEGFIEQVLFYARSSTVERDYIIKKIPLKNSINSVIRKNANILIEKRVKIQLEDIEKKVYCDSKWIEFILQQIISNSVKYMDKDEKYIKIRCLEKDKNIILKILDNGIGISEKSIEKVFEKGYTGENGRKYNNSTGMGLYLCKKLCLKLGLGISIKSKLGVGTEVTIVFPINNYNLAED